jgi:nucleotide-binding universal stress UspA family protein
MKPLVLAYDGSRDAENAIAYAGRVLAPREARVVHVWAGISHLILNPRYRDLVKVLRDEPSELDAPDREEAERLAAEGARLAVEAGFGAQPVAVEQRDKVWHAILGAAEDAGATAIVAGTSGHTGLADVILASNAYGLVNHSPLPTLLVPPATRSDQETGPVLLCYDGSEGARHAIEVAGVLLRNHKARVFHSWESWTARANLVGAVSGSVAGMARELDEIGEVQSSDLVDDGCGVAAEAGFRALPVSGRYRGPAWTAILDRASEENASLIVVGSRGMSGLSAVLGSVSHGVVHHAKRPVLVVPA